MLEAKLNNDILLLHLDAFGTTDDILSPQVMVQGKQKKHSVLSNERVLAVSQIIHQIINITQYSPDNTDRKLTCSLFRINIFIQQDLSGAKVQRIMTLYCQSLYC